MLLDKIKKQIKENAILAVKKAEKELGSGNGKLKKAQAVKFIISKLSAPDFIKPVIGMLLSKIIDDTVEIAVYCMNLFCEEK